MITPDQVKYRRQIEAYIDQELLEKWKGDELTIPFPLFAPEDVDAVTQKYSAYWVFESKLDHNKRRICTFNNRMISL